MRGDIEIVDTGARAGTTKWTIVLSELAAPGAGRIRGLHLVGLTSGQVRGNHFHELRDEWICVIGSRVLLASQHERGERRERVLAAHPVPVLVHVPARVGHALKNLGGDDAYAIVFSDDSGGSDDDVHPLTLIEA